MAVNDLKTEGVIALLAKLSKKQLLDLAFTCVDCLIDRREVFYRENDPDPVHGGPADICWYGNGESLIEDSQ